MDSASPLSRQGDFTSEPYPVTSNVLRRLLFHPDMRESFRQPIARTTTIFFNALMVKLWQSDFEGGVVGPRAIYEVQLGTGEGLLFEWVTGREMSLIISLESQSSVWPVISVKGNFPGGGTAFKM
ncbi:hypothetical protein M413DRAFT_14227 [Hebeloma cylindrosporum]|uniref:Uncharacterized protein n=1 Tax=Hebeloma cylindrosporum TaxID=76867 RepID=A0A0C3BH04_HEBCY|nr:hypothetical protein M413DRAFT_14227 [Hebeloma cylindrosporum h7]